LTAIAGDYSVIVVVIVGQNVECWVIIAPMVLMDQWHLSDGIKYCDGV
jgi:hypothetical protein